MSFFSKMHEANGEQPDEGSELVTVARFLDPAEAQMARSALESAGIATFLQGENANSLVPMAFRTRLQVARADETGARDLLRSAEQVEDAEADGDDAA